MSLLDAETETEIKRDFGKNMHWKMFFRTVVVKVFGVLVSALRIVVVVVVKLVSIPVLVRERPLRQS